MENEKEIPIRRYSIEDALARALPLDAWGWDSGEGWDLIQTFVRKKLDTVVVGTRGRSRQSHPKIPNMVFAEVDLDEYLELYDTLLNNPNLVQNYLGILDADARNYVLRSCETHHSALPIHYLFGIYDHADIYSEGAH